MKRTALARKTPLRATEFRARAVTGEGGTRARIKAKSAKRAARERIYTKLRAEFLEANPTCARCGRPATDVHHRRGRVGDLYLDTRFWTALDRACHCWVGTSPAAAIEAGLSEKRLSA